MRIPLSPHACLYDARDLRQFELTWVLARPARRQQLLDQIVEEVRFAREFTQPVEQQFYTIKGINED